MSKEKKLSSGEKAAHVTGRFSTRIQIIAGIFLLLGILIPWFLDSKNQETSQNEVQHIRDQRIDTGSINNFNANGNITIENKNYTRVEEKPDSSNSIKTPLKENVQINVTSNNQSGGQTASQINNNY